MVVCFPGAKIEYITERVENMVGHKVLLMAENLNGYFSSVFREDISSLTVADAKFQEAKSDCLGQLVVTPEMVAKKIKTTKDNKSPGVDGNSRTN